MPPLDPRLLASAKSARVYLTITVVLGTASAFLVVAFSYLLARIITDAFQQDDGFSDLGPLLGWLVVVVLSRVAFSYLLARIISNAFQQDEGFSDLGPLLGWLVVVVLLRSVVGYLQEGVAARSSAGVKHEFRVLLLAKVSALGPVWLSGQRRSDLVLLMGRGLDALDNYFARYLPQLVLSVIVPIVVISVMFTQDWLSALIVLLTLPLIPVFMVLIGWTTQRAQERQWHSLTLLAGHFLDVVRGLPTLKVFGRAKAQGRLDTCGQRRVSRPHHEGSANLVSVISGFGVVSDTVGRNCCGRDRHQVGQRLADVVRWALRPPTGT